MRQWSGAQRSAKIDDSTESIRNVRCEFAENAMVDGVLTSCGDADCFHGYESEGACNDFNLVAFESGILKTCEERSATVSGRCTAADRERTCDVKLVRG